MLIVKDVHEEEPSSTVEEMEPKNHQDENNINEERLKEPNDGVDSLLTSQYSTPVCWFSSCCMFVCADEEAIRKDTGSRGSMIEKNIESMAKGNYTEHYVLE